MGDRRAEQRQDRVADDLVDPTTEGLDVEDESLETAVDEVLDVFGVSRFGHRREPDKVGEQDGDDSSLVGPTLQRLTAGRAEPGAFTRGRPTRRAGHAEIL
jgi:hypothetical protein